MRILKRSSNIPPRSTMSAVAGKAGVIGVSTLAWLGCSSETLDVCGTELTSSDSLQSGALPPLVYLVRTNVRAEREVSHSANSWSPPFSSPAYLGRPRACPVYQADCVLLC